MTLIPYETEAWREPKHYETDTVVCSEHGRIAYNIDYRSHWFVLVRGEFKHYALLVKHGGGEERIPMPAVNFGFTADVIFSLPSDERYLMLHHLYDVYLHARREAEDATAAKFKRAFVDGRLKKRRLPRRGYTKVWIEDGPRECAKKVAS
jgi:hypothetical protein